MAACEEHQQHKRVPYLEQSPHLSIKPSLCGLAQPPIMQVEGTNDLANIRQEQVPCQQPICTQIVIRSYVSDQGKTSQKVVH